MRYSINKDERIIQFIVGDKDGKIVVDFGKSLRWITMTPAQATEFAEGILKRANKINRE